MCLLKKSAMATEKQIAANRANASRSTGPKSLPGRMKSSRNAFRHGLSSPMPIDALSAESLEASYVRLLTVSVAPSNSRPQPILH